MGEWERVNTFSVPHLVRKPASYYIILTLTKSLKITHFNMILLDFVPARQVFLTLFEMTVFSWQGTYSCRKPGNMHFTLPRMPRGRDACHSQ